MTTPENGVAMLEQFASSNAVLENYVKTTAQQLADKERQVSQLSKKNGEYKIENDLLHAKLAEALNSRNVPLQGNMSSAPELPARETSSGTVAPHGRTTIPLVDYQNLVQKYSNDIKAHEISRKKLVEKAHKLKETCKNWQTWGDRIQRKLNLKNNRIRDLEDENFGLRQALRKGVADDSSRPSTASTSSAVPLPAAHLRVPSSQPESTFLPAPAAERVVVAIREYEILDKEGPLVNAVAHQPTTRILEHPLEDGKIEAAEEMEPNSSQTTAGLDPGLLLANNGHANIPVVLYEEPIFISENTTRKRKRGALGTKSNASASVCNNKDGYAARPIRLKEEPPSSPVESSAKQVVTRTETLDLDEIGDRIDTPRKRRQIQYLKRKSSLKTTAMEDVRHQRLASLPPDIQQEESVSHSSLPGNLEEHDPLNLSPGRRETVSPLPKLENDDSRALSEPFHSFIVNAEPPYETTPSRHNQRPLQSVTINQRILPWTSNIYNKRGRLGDPERGARALHLVAEDGNFLDSETPSKSPESRKRADKRLEELLEQPTPARRTFTPVPNPQRLAQQTVPRVNSPVTRETPVSVNTPTAAMLKTPKSMSLKPRRTSEVPSTLAKLKCQTPRYVKPLRERAVTGLRLEDFKPNVKKYPGMDASSAEPARGREARRHMAGCTDPNCVMCGDQLRQLAAELPITAPTSLFASTQDEELTEDERLLRYYLGDGFNREQIAWMNKTDRERLVVQAKEQIVAERFSKHRIKPNQRGKSPPGFWDIDMASTQELDRQREEADRMEKVQVAERYREALKGDGRWLFKDE